MTWSEPPACARNANPKALLEAVPGGVNETNPVPSAGAPSGWSVLFAYSFQGAKLYYKIPVFPSLLKGGRMTLRMRVHDKEPIGMALRRFKKLIERSGMQKELRAHQHYEKPSELRRRARLRKEKAARKARGQQM